MYVKGKAYHRAKDAHKIGNIRLPVASIERRILGIRLDSQKKVMEFVAVVKQYGLRFVLRKGAKPLLHEFDGAIGQAAQQTESTEDSLYVDCDGDLFFFDIAGSPFGLSAIEALSSCVHSWHTMYTSPPRVAQTSPHCPPFARKRDRTLSMLLKRQQAQDALACQSSDSMERKQLMGIA